MVRWVGGGLNTSEERESKKLWAENAVSATMDATGALSGYCFRPTCFSLSHMQFLTLWLMDCCNYIMHNWNLPRSGLRYAA